MLEVHVGRAVWRTGKVPQEEFNFFRALNLQPTDQELTDKVQQNLDGSSSSLQAVQQVLEGETDNIEQFLDNGWTGPETEPGGTGQEPEVDWSQNPDTIKYTVQYKDCNCTTTLEAASGPGPDTAGHVKIHNTKNVTHTRNVTVLTTSQGAVSGPTNLERSSHD